MQNVNMNAYQTPLGTLNGSISNLYGDADGQVSGTIDLMRQYATEDAGFPRIVACAAFVRSLVTSQDDLMQTLHAYVRRSLVFVDDQDALKEIAGPGVDANTIELLRRPADVALLIDQNGFAEGDCDDFSMFCASLLLALQAQGEPISNVRFVTISPRGMVENGRDFSHVFVRCSYHGNDISLDCSHGKYAGWCYTDNNREAEWPLRSSSTTVLVAFALLAIPLVSNLFRRIL